jgi:hypothetical protein
MDCMMKKTGIFLIENQMKVPAKSGSLCDGVWLSQEHSQLKSKTLATSKPGKVENLQCLV